MIEKRWRYNIGINWIFPISHLLCCNIIDTELRAIPEFSSVNHKAYLVDATPILAS